MHGCPARQADAGSVIVRVAAARVVDVVAVIAPFNSRVYFAIATAGEGAGGEGVEFTQRADGD